MKISGKPILSPNRAEKFPPPLIRRLRSNGRSSSSRKSLRKSLSSPMFSVLRKKSSIETQEPSSPKVTCIGQVRVKSKQINPTKSRSWRCKNQAPFCNCFAGKQAQKSKDRSPINVWRRFFMVFQVGSQGKVEISEKGDQISKGDPKPEVEPRTFPPKNALLLMRCRSEPLRSSSFADRFWDSPVRIEGARENKTEQNGDQSEEESEVPNGRMQVKSPETSEAEDEEIVKMRKTSTCVGDDYNSISKQETAVIGNVLKPDQRDQVVNSSLVRSRSSSEVSEFWVSSYLCENSHAAEIGKLGSRHPLVLTRCMSEPARFSARRLHLNY